MYTCGGTAATKMERKKALDALIANKKWMVGYQGTGGKCPGKNWWYNGKSRCFKLLADAYNREGRPLKYNYDEAVAECKKQTDVDWGLKAGDASLLQFKEDEDFTMLYWASATPHLSTSPTGVIGKIPKKFQINSCHEKYM